MEEIAPSSAPDAEQKPQKRGRGRVLGQAPILPRHRKVLALVNEGMPMTRAMRAVGYSPNTVSQMHVVKKSQSWQKLMEEQLPDQLLATRHRELLDKREMVPRVVGKGKNQRVELVDAGVDVTAVKAGLEMAYKLKGKVTPEQVPTAPTIQVNNLFYKPEVRASLSAFEDNLKQFIAHGPTKDVVEEISADAQAQDADEGRAEPSADGGTVHADDGEGDDAGAGGAPTVDSADAERPA